tara:strand:- start:91 stop:504 length:414 start_codon:yes stop_codon:yes gene_type:complete
MAELGKKVGSELGNALGSTIGSVASQGGNFLQLMKDFNVIGFALGVMMANNVAELANSFIDGIVMPTIQPAMDKVTGEDGTGVQIGNVYIDLTKFLNSFIKFVALSVVIFLIIQFGFTITKPVSWVSVRSVAPGVKL